MDSVNDWFVDLQAGLGGVNLADIALKIVFLTVPGLALAHGLKRLRDPGGGPPGGKITAALHQPMIKLASFVTLLAMLAAGLGLVPLAHAVYELLSGVNKWAPALIGVAVVALLLLKGLVMARDLMDGKVDRPYLWLAPVPLAAMLIWVTPVVVSQISDQAGQTVHMIVNQQAPDGQRQRDQSRLPQHKSKDKKRSTRGNQP